MEIPAIRYRAKLPIQSSLVNITFELSGPKRRSLFGSGGGTQCRNVLERFVICHLAPSVGSRDQTLVSCSSLHDTQYISDISVLL